MKACIRQMATLLVLCGANQLGAWGPDGHHIVARLAAGQITDPKARQTLMAVLEGDKSTTNQCHQTDFVERLACVSTWADDVRRAMPQTYNWHFVDIPKDKEFYDATRDCPPNERGDCALRAIARSAQLLTSGAPSISDQEKADALKFLIHIVGDIHQPLHCIDDHDKGGNDKKAIWFGQKDNVPYGAWNLHSVWDVGLLNRSSHVPADANPRDLAYVNYLSPKLNPSLISAANSGEPQDWVEEGHLLAVRQTYGTLPPAQQNTGLYEIGDKYLQDNLSTVELQLLRGGVRLAKVLNMVATSVNGRL